MFFFSFIFKNVNAQATQKQDAPRCCYQLLFFFCMAHSMMNDYEANLLKRLWSERMSEREYHYGFFSRNINAIAQ